MSHKTSISWRIFTLACTICYLPLTAKVVIGSGKPSPKESARLAQTHTTQAPPIVKKTKTQKDRIVGGRVRKKKGQREKKLTIKDMNYEQLKELKQRLQTQNKTDSVINCLEKMVPLCKDANELKTIMLELADHFFDAGKLAKAEKLYTEYAKLYPGSETIETVLYKAILCAFYSTLDAERDQTKTHDALELTQKFLERAQLFTTYAQEVKKIQTQCHTKLFESEENVIHFYIKRGFEKDVTSAKNRIALAQKEYASRVPEAKPRLLALEVDLAERTKDYQLASKKQYELASRFPDYTKTRQLASNKKLAIHRF